MLFKGDDDLSEEQKFVGKQVKDEEGKAIEEQKVGEVQAAFKQYKLLFDYDSFIFNGINS
jgi:hypothetical protein